MQQLSLVAMYWREERGSILVHFLQPPLSCTDTFPKHCLFTYRHAGGKEQGEERPQGSPAAQPQPHPVCPTRCCPVQLCSQQPRMSNLAQGGSSLRQQTEAGGGHWEVVGRGGVGIWGVFPEFAHTLLPFSELTLHLVVWSLLQPGLRGGRKVRQGMEILHLVTSVIKLTHRFKMGAGRSFTLIAQGKATVAIWIICTNYQLPYNKGYFGIM